MKAKVALTASVVFVLFVASISFISFRYFEREFKNSIYTQQFALVSALTKTIDDKLRISHGALIASAAKINPEFLQDEEKAQAFLDQQAALQSMFDTGLMLLSKDGSLVAESPFRPGRRGRDMSPREFFQHSIITKTPYISKPYASTRSKGEPALRMTAPIFDKNGVFQGLLVGRMDLLGDNLMVQIGKVKNGNKGYVYMTDRDGLMILHPDKKRLLTATVGKNPMYDKAHAGFEGTGETITSYGDAVIVTFKRVESTGWIFASNYMLSEAQAPFQRALHYVSAAIGIGCILLIAVISTLMRRLIDPLSQFTDHVATLAAKSGEERLMQHDGRGEIGILVGAFNQMIGTLEKQQNTLAQNESRLAGMIDESPVGVFETDIHGNCNFVNNRWCEIAGITPREAMGDGWYRALHPDDVRRVWDEWLVATNKAAQFRSSYRFVHADGSVRWVLGQAAPIFDEKGLLTAYVGTNTDITEQTLAEEEIQRLASIVRYSPDFIGITDIAGRATFINEAGRSLVGMWDGAQFGDVTLADFFCENERAMVQEQILPHLMRDGRWRGEIQFRNFHSGQSIPVWFDIFRIDDPSGRPINFATVTRDITERKRMDQELSNYREHLEELVQERTQELHQAQQIGHMGNWQWDVVSGKINWSDEVCRIFGYQPGQYEPTMERLLSTLHPDDVERIRDSMQSVYLKGERHSLDHRIVWPDGSLRWVHAEAVATMGADGKPLRFSGTVQDITERKKVEQELIESREAAESASRAKSLFLSSMSHELRTPLNAVLGFAQLLSMEEDLSEDVHNSAAEIEKAGRHLLALVNDILDLARIESGRVELSIEDVDPAEILRDCNKLLEPQAKARGISLDLLPTVPVTLRGDRMRLRQVLLNLLSNAVKYNRDGGKVTVRGEVRPNRRYRLLIKDTGPGIAQERLSELFQPFNRIGAERGAIEGTGIGLVITKTLVQAMDGQIGVESVLGEGSTFWLELALASDTRSPEPEEELQARYSGLILAAEDHEPNRKLLRRQIEKLGYRVDFACDGSEALEKWQAGDYDLLLTDCNMAVMDGYELAQAIRAKEAMHGGRIPIIALTANAMKDAAAACSQAGMDDFLAKPVQLQQLQEVLQRWLGGAREKSGIRHARAMNMRVQPEQRPAYAEYLENLVQMLGEDDPEEVAHMLHAFLDAAAECLNEAKWALQRRDTITFVRASHRLKSSARMIGATALSDLCQRCEQAGLRGEWSLLEAEMPSLDASLRETEERIQTLPRTRPSQLPEARSQELQGLHVMLVDDDPFMLDYLCHLLNLRGAQGVRQEREARTALLELEKNSQHVDVVMVDVNMPGMDGVEFLRHLALAGFSGAVIIISGAADLLPSIYELAQAHGLRILGTLAKPFMPERLYELLRSQHSGLVSAIQQSAYAFTPAEMATGLARGEFEAWFQPKMDLRTGRASGAEALARWRRADGSLIPPLQFVPLMEAHGLIDGLFLNMLQATMRAARILREHGFEHLKLAINLAASTLGTINLPEHIDQQLREHEIKPESLIIEITEAGVMQDARIGLDVLLRLRLKGVGLSIDDFGTGYSTIDQLRRLPFTELKIDRAFVASAAHNPQAKIILQSSVEMAKRLQLQTVAEGVETEQDMNLVRDLGCDVVQGFMLAEAMPLPEFIAWLQNNAGQGGLPGVHK